MKYQVAIGRRTYEYLDLVVEAPLPQAAATIARQQAIDNSNDPAWSPGDCDYYETGVEDVAADTPLGVVGQIVASPPLAGGLPPIVKHGDGAISGVVKIELSRFIDCNLEGVLDMLSEALTGTQLLMNVNYKVVGHDGDTLLIEVSGDPEQIAGCKAE
jgi:hypothetical protein